MSLEKVQIPSQRPVYPTPAGLVTTVDRDGNPNIITLGEIYNLSIRKPVIVGLGIAPQRYSHRLLCECLPRPHRQAMQHAGRRSRSK